MGYRISSIQYQLSIIIFSLILAINDTFSLTVLCGHARIPFVKIKGKADDATVAGILPPRLPPGPIEGLTYFQAIPQVFA